MVVVATATARLVGLLMMALRWGCCDKRGERSLDSGSRELLRRTLCEAMFAVCVASCCLWARLLRDVGAALIFFFQIRSTPYAVHRTQYPSAAPTVLGWGGGGLCKHHLAFPPSAIKSELPGERLVELIADREFIEVGIAVAEAFM